MLSNSMRYRFDFILFERTIQFVRTNPMGLLPDEAAGRVTRMTSLKSAMTNGCSRKVENHVFAKAGPRQESADSDFKLTHDRFRT